MDFITIEELRSQPASVWKKLAKAHELVITRNGKPFALLTETSPTKLEDDLRALRRARTQVALDSMRAQARERGLAKLSLDNVNTEIRAARKTVKGRHAPRSGWPAAFSKMSQHQDDKLLDETPPSHRMKLSEV